MDLFDIELRAFRNRLRRELPRWRDEGLIDEPAARTLATRYRLDEDRTGAALVAVYLLGALLIGGGVISFVAWNWARLPTPLKLAIIGTAMVAAHALGYWLWRIDGRWPRLGHAVVFLGTLIFGANIGLVAQIFHVSSTWYGGFGAWAVGAAVAGWALRSLPNASLAIVLAFVWSVGFLSDHEGAIPFTPYLVLAVFLPLAWLERSRFLFLLAALAAGLLVVIGAGTETENVVAVVAASFAISALFLAYSLAPPPEGRGAAFAPVAALLGLAGLATTAYVCSFHEAAEGMTFLALEFETFWWLLAAAPALAAAIALVAIAWSRQERLFRERPVTLAALGAVALLLAVMAVPEPEVAVAATANAGLAAVGGVAIASSIRTLNRGAWWGGTLLLGLLIVSRFFEFETGLWLKAIVFTACGVGVIVVGALFERRLKLGRGGHAA